MHSHAQANVKEAYSGRQRMLTKATGSDQVPQMLSGHNPARVHVPNHKSVETHKPIVHWHAETAKCVDKAFKASVPSSHSSRHQRLINGVHMTFLLDDG